MSRYFNVTQREKISAGKGPMPGNGNGGKKLSIPESTAKWDVSKADSYNPNKVGFPKVKQSVKTTI